MTTPGGGPLTTDFDLMTAVAGKTDARNEEIRAMLQSFIGRMGSVPPSVWGGVAAARFRDIVERWNAESMKLHAALQRIARPFATTRELCVRPAKAIRIKSVPSPPTCKEPGHGSRAVVQLRRN
jgi:uncharacterized protein YukE